MGSRQSEHSSIKSNIKWICDEVLKNRLLHNPYILYQILLAYLAIVNVYFCMELHQFFKNLKVVELANVLAGPSVGMFLAELGAKVIKVENKITDGDVTRHWKLPQEDKDQPWSAYYHSVNWNKETHLLNLKDKQDHKEVLAWIKEADIVITNFKPGSATKVGMDYSSLSQLNSRLIYANITAYDEHDPSPGFDVIIQAETGWMFMNGEPDGPPVKMPVALMDILAAHQLKEGILLALLNREQTGKGCQVNVSLFDTGIASLANQASNWLNLEVVPQRIGSRHPNISPYGDVFFTKDKQAVIVAPGTEKQFFGLCECLELKHLNNDERFSSNAKRLAHRDELYQLLAAACSEFTASELLVNCKNKGVPLAPIRNMQEVFEIPAARRLILEEPLPDGSTSKRVKSVIFKIKSHEDHLTP